MDTSFRLFPEQASSISGRVDALFEFLVVVSGIATLLIAAAILYFAIKYRRGSPANRTPAAGHFVLLEATWIGIPFVLSLITFFWGARLYFDQTHAPDGALEIACVARQWMWKFQHPEGHAEINDLHVPLGRPVKVRLISEDVIHSLYLPAFRIKQDVLPGRYTSLWFEATKVGQYHLFCAEYCGAKHSSMGGRVIVLEPSDYEAWLSGRAETEPATAGGQRMLDELRCNNCHSGGGMASRCPPLENLFGRPVKLQDGRTIVADESYIRESVLHPAAKVVAGYQPIMPSYEGQIGEEGILRLIAEIKSLSPRSTAAGEGATPKSGSAPP